MRKLLPILLLSALMASCSSTSVDNKNDILAGIENSDFKPKATVKYVSRNDVFKGEESKHDSTSDESVNRLPEPKLMKLEEGEDPINKAISLCYLKKYKKADAIFKQIFDKYRKSPSYWNQIGTCYLLQNEERKASLFYDKARRLDGKYAPALNNIGVLLLRQGKTEAALKSFKEASRVNSFSLTPLFNMATIYLKYGFKDKAYRMFQVLYKKNRYDVDVLNGLGTYYMMNNDPRKAIAFYNQIDDAYLRRPDISINYAYALHQVGEKGDARDLFRKINTNKLSDLASYYSKVKKIVEE